MTTGATPTLRPATHKNQAELTINRQGQQKALAVWAGEIPWSSLGMARQDGQAAELTENPSTLTSVMTPQ